MAQSSKRLFAKTQTGEEIYEYTLQNSNGSSVSVLNYGGIIRSIRVLDKEGKVQDVILGCDSFEDYLQQDCYFGAIVGRYANRIKAAKFTLGNIEYNLNKNNGNVHLHGGKVGFDKKIYEVKEVDDGITLSMVSPDGDEGYPGNLQVHVTYTFNNENELKISYFAKSDQDTIVNLTSHGYFNLSGHKSGDVLDQEIEIKSSKVTKMSEDLSPNGEIIDVKGSPLDFSQFKAIGKDLKEQNDQMIIAGGYDFNYILETNSISKVAARAISKKTGIKLTMYTDQPCVQLYTSNYVENVRGKDGAIYQKRSAFCLESQGYPDAMAHDNFTSPILKAGEAYNRETIYKFGIEK